MLIKSLTIITPIFNEEEILVKSIQKTLKSLSSYFKDIEYVIVNDGSFDNSKRIIEEEFQKPPFKIIHKENGGFGSAFRKGLEVVTKEYVICVPADSPIDNETAKKFYEKYLLADIVVSYRKNRCGYSTFMKVNSFLYIRIIRLLFDVYLKDYNWIHLYNTKVVKSLSIKSNGVFMLAEVLIEAVQNKNKIVEIEVIPTQRTTGIPSATRLSTIIITIYEMMNRFFYHILK